MTVTPIKLRRISANRFEVLAGLSRSPAIGFIATELEHYSNEDETYVGVILIDHTDQDYSALVMARDEQGKFSCMDTKVSISTVDEARTWISCSIKWHTGTGVRVHEQGRKPQAPLDIFRPVVPPEKQHVYFQRLISHKAFSGARKVISEMMPHYIDVDGNLMQQFQSNGFDSRLWELYLFALLKESGFVLDRSYAAPDFLGNRFGYEIALEAVIVGRKPGETISPFSPVAQLPTPAEIEEKLKNEMPIKFGSPLFSKLKKKYWEMEHVRGKPFVVAIADFHDELSMIWSSSALYAYLYGKRYELTKDSDGSLRAVRIDITSHTHEGKTIPSGFFEQEDSQNISAVLTTASGTTSKFNRMGRQAGYGDPKIRMLRIGTCHDHDPSALLPKRFYYEVNESSSERWSEGVNVFHNPNAKVPLEEDAFPFAGHHRLIDGDIVSRLPDFHPFASWTFDVCPRGTESSRNAH
jgi:hypothetical protein